MFQTSSLPAEIKNWKSVMGSGGLDISVVVAPRTENRSFPASWLTMTGTDSPISNPVYLPSMKSSYTPNLHKGRLQNKLYT